jgi:hypothetical protein
MGAGLGTELTGGVVLIALAVVMIYFGRPKRGEEAASFLKGPWIIGQIYVMTSMISFVGGVALLLSHWPY